VIFTLYVSAFGERLLEIDSLNANSIKLQRSLQKSGGFDALRLAQRG